MSQFPSLPLFTDAFIADTGHLSAQETGAYAMLLMIAWRSPGCRLPDNDDKLARWARVDRRTWLRIKPAVMEFWTLSDGSWTQKRLSKEHDKVSKHAEVARENGKHGGRPKPLKINGADNPAGSRWATHKKAPNPNPISKSTRREKERARATAFPSHFEPNETDRRVAEEVGCRDLPAEVEHWRDHHVAKGSVFKDWHAALRTWLRSPLRVQRPARAPPVNGARQPVPFPRRQEPSHVSSTRGSAADELRRQLAEDFERMRPDDRESLCPGSLRLLS
jgi:uncharacterized protein YdaU (DUF1376 family)